MLDLQAGVYFEEKEVITVGVVDELHRAGGAIVHALTQLDRRCVECGSCFIRESRSRRFFEDFLVPALDRAVALAEG